MPKFPIPDGPMAGIVPMVQGTAVEGAVIMVVDGQATWVGPGREGETRYPGRPTPVRDDAVTLVIPRKTAAALAGALNDAIDSCPHHRVEPCGICTEFNQLLTFLEGGERMYMAPDAVQ